MARLQDLFLVAAVVVASSSLSAATLTVDLNGGADYIEIQPAIDAAAEGDTVLVKPGEYVITEPINFNRLHDPANPASPPVKNIIVKSEGGAEVTTIRMAETPTDPNRASVMIFESGEMIASALEGLTLTAGKGSAGYGGGVYCNNSSPTLAKCTISGNSATDWCTVICYRAGGGGVYCDNSSPNLTNCTISGNLSLDGGGVYCEGGSSPNLTNCTISGNGAWVNGGGVYCDNSSPTLTNCTIAENRGPALCLGGGSIPALTNSILFALWAGPLLSWEEGASAPRITSCLLYWNASDAELETLANFLGDLDFFFDDPLFVDPGHWNDNGTPDDTSDDKWIPGDYHLQPGSPAIDDGTSEGAPSTDIEGTPRPQGSGVDIGAYEYVPGGLRIPGDSNGDGTLDISDAVATLGFLFLGSPAKLSCGDGSATDPANLKLVDWQPDGAIDISDGVAMLSFLFLGGHPHALAVPGTETKSCVRIVGCQDRCGP